MKKIISAICIATSLSSFAVKASVLSETIVGSWNFNMPNSISKGELDDGKLADLKTIKLNRIQSSEILSVKGLMSCDKLEENSQLGLLFAEEMKAKGLTEKDIIVSPKMFLTVDEDLRYKMTMKMEMKLGEASFSCGDKRLGTFTEKNDILIDEEGDLFSAVVLDQNTINLDTSK